MKKHKLILYSFIILIVFLIGFSIGKMFPDMQSTHLLDRSAMYQSKDKNYTLSLPPEDSNNGFLLSITEPTKAYNLMGEYERISESVGILTVETGEKMYIAETWSGPKECILLVDTKKQEHILFKIEEGYVILKKTENGYSLY